MANAGNGCPACGAPVTRHLGGALCPACLVALALAEDEPETGAPAGLPAHAYQVVSLLGRERGRVIYLARRQDFHALVSLETIDRSALGDLAREALTARAAALCSLRHPGIAAVLEAWQEQPDEWCVVSEYLAGRPVGASACPTPMDGLTIFDLVCRTIAAAHTQGVVHGRLDTASVVLVDAGDGVEPRLTGFTLTNRAPELADDLTGLGKILAALTANTPVAAAAAALAAGTEGTGTGAPFPTLEDFRAAASSLQNQSWPTPG